MTSDDAPEVKASAKDREFPVLRGKQREPRTVPWSWLAKFSARIQCNHGQTLELLARRGGLSPTEIWLAAHDQKYTAPVPPDEAVETWLSDAIKRAKETL